MELDDVPPIIDWLITIPLWQRYQLTADKARTQFEQAFKREDSLLVADLGQKNRACGFVWGVVGGGFGRSFYLRMIGVRQNCAGTGVGSALLTQTEQIALSTAGDLFLLVSDFNLDAQRFYRRHGYQQVGAIPGYVLPDVTELIFRKRLRT